MPNPRCCSVQGHHTNKSTVFSPNGAKFGQQSMLHDHMMNHYKLIDRAKSSIDNKPPKCMTKFIKAQDRKSKLQKSLTQNKKIDSYQQLVPSNDTYKRQIHSSLLAFNEEDANRIEEDFLRNEEDNFSPFHQLDSPMESFAMPRAATAPSYKSRTAIPPSRSSTPKYKIEMYAPKAQQPTLKGSMYNKPLIVGDRQISPEIKASSFYNFTDSKNGVWSNRNISYKKPSALDRSMRLDMSFLSLDEQLSHTQTLNKYTNKELPYYEVDRLQKQEELIAEEQLYLQFIEEVTNDILTRGIFSDRVLNQVFDSHLEKRKGHLNEERMRTMIDELKIDLNVQDSTPSINHFQRNTIQSSSKPSREVVIKRHNSSDDFAVENAVPPVFGDLDNVSSVGNETFEEDDLLNADDNSEKYDIDSKHSQDSREIPESSQHIKDVDGDNAFGNLPTSTQPETVDEYENEDFENVDDENENDGSEGEF